VNGNKMVNIQTEINYREVSVINKTKLAKLTGQHNRKFSAFRIQNESWILPRRCPHTYESGWRVRLGSGSNESNSSVCGVSRAGLGRFWLGSLGPSVGLGLPPACYWLVRVWEVYEPIASQRRAEPHRRP